jgi:hypothetical protein
MSKWFPRIAYKKYDGGKESGVIGYCLIEWKILFSIVLLKFNNGSRENYHSHAFNAITWFLRGRVREETYESMFETVDKWFIPSFIPKITRRGKIHRVHSFGTTWALSFRGPWSDTWYEIDKNNKIITLTHGRKQVQ